MNYCMSIGINIEHPLSNVHIQNGLVESFIKHLQLIAQPLLMRAKLPLSVWSHAILHATSLICIRSTCYHKYSSIQLAYGRQIFLICEYLVVQYIFQFFHHNIIYKVKQTKCHMHLQILRKWSSHIFQLQMLI